MKRRADVVSSAVGVDGDDPAEGEDVIVVDIEWILRRLTRLPLLMDCMMKNPDYTTENSKPTLKQPIPIGNIRIRI